MKSWLLEDDLVSGTCGTLRKVGEKPLVHSPGLFASHESLVTLHVTHEI